MPSFARSTISHFAGNKADSSKHVANAPIVRSSSSFVKIAEEYFPAAPICEKSDSLESEVSPIEARREEPLAAAPLWDRPRSLRSPVPFRFAICAPRCPRPKETLRYPAIRGSPRARLPGSGNVPRVAKSENGQWMDVEVFFSLLQFLSEKLTNSI